ncbi:succinate dehydrogenase, cytochrome b556 subunit [uncultured Thiodictyon sp.]|jgi:succinate dehydrogenase / fumarate reductase cytochrome b subunit|uniref:succinate dehydrogenase, cytochrome b556 subunit n=1 Tax=uncultured Thiodictyon sp. TaxID=1846217 RepID=UPI0025F119E1|nr:succinate dehydrogenase, cytochrome b556 subunit [uncultured Thiodictyon sp.]
MQSTRPVFLDLWRIRLPATGYVSIFHRISGVLMVLAIPVGAIIFDQAVSGPEGFAASAAFLHHWLVRLALIALAWSILHHLFAGIRYLLLDLRIGLDRASSRVSAWVVMVAAVVVLGLVLIWRIAQ